MESKHTRATVLNEITALQRIASKNIVKIIDYGISGTLEVTEQIGEGGSKSIQLHEGEH